MKITSSFLRYSLFLVLLGAGLKVQGQSYPSIPGNPTEFKNTNTPDPFTGTFYNGGNPVYTIPYSENIAYCIDRSVPVCDGTKDPLSLGSTNTNTQLAYAMYLLKLGGHSDNTKRELIWAIMGQTNSCSGNSACNDLLTTVQKIPTSGTPLSLSISTNKSTYKTNEKIIITVTTNVHSYYIGGYGTNGSGLTGQFCDASGNPIATPPGASISGVYITYPISGSAPQTYYVLAQTSNYTGSGAFETPCIPTASNVSLWTRAGCQPLAFLMPTIDCNPVSFNIVKCSNAVLNFVPATCTAGTANNNGQLVLTGFDPTEKYDLAVTHDYSGNPIQPTFSGTTIPSGGIISNNVVNVYPSSGYPATPGTKGWNVGGANARYDVFIQDQNNTCFTMYDAYVPDVTCSGGGGCTAPSTLVITPRNTSLSTGGTLDMLVAAHGTTASTTYSWSGSGGSFVSGTVNPAVWNRAATAGTYNFTVTVSNSTCTATATSSLSLSTAVAATGSNISLKKTISNTSPNTGDSVTYTVIITNAGPEVATNVVLKDVLPASLTFVSVSTGAGTYNTGTGLWTIGTVPVGQRTVTMTVTVN